MTHLLRAVVGLMLLPTLLGAQGDAVPPDLAGVYTCEGLNADGSAYHAVVEIAAHGEMIWKLRWIFEQSGEAIGFGLVQHGVLAVIYRLDNGEIGLVAYAIEKKQLIGRWTVPGADVTSTETLTKTAVRNPALLQGPRRRL